MMMSHLFWINKTRWDFSNVVLSICNVLTSGYGGAQLPVLKVMCPSEPHVPLNNFNVHLCIY